MLAAILYLWRARSKPIYARSRQHLPKGVNTDDVSWALLHRLGDREPVKVGVLQREWHSRSNGEEFVLCWQRRK